MQTTLTQFREVPTQETAGHTLHCADDFGDAERGRVLEQKMNMIDLSVELQERSSEDLADRANMLFQRRQVMSIEDASTVLGNEDQMYIQIRYARATVSKFAGLLHGIDYLAREPSATVSRTKTPTFVLELSLQTSASDDREMGIRREMLRQISNATLGEGLRRLDLMRESKAYRSANKLPRGTVETCERQTGSTAEEQVKLDATYNRKVLKNVVERAKIKVRADAFEIVNEKFGFLPVELQKFAQKCQREAPAIALHTGSHDLQTTVTRVWKALERHAFGKGGRPKFKGYREVQSVEGKSNDACILFRAEKDLLVVKWSGLVLPVIFDPNDDWQHRVLAEHRTKYVRIVWREIHGKTRVYAQFAQEGLPPPRKGHAIGTEVIGIDIGPSTIAVVGETSSILEPLCPGVVVPAAAIRRIQRKMDRSRRASNPEAFNSDGTYKKGAKARKRSKVYQEDRAKKAEIERRLAAERKRSHGELSNRVLAVGNQISTEDVSFKGWQKSRYGKSIGKRAPSMLMAILGRKAKAFGGSVRRFSTQTTKLSQVDHTTGLYTKKPLSQREHVLSDGSRVQRDLYSALLARFVGNDDRLDLTMANRAWSGAGPLLCATSSDQQAANGVGFALPCAPRERDAGAAVTRNQHRGGREVSEVVAAVAAMQRAVRAEKSVRKVDHVNLGVPRRESGCSLQHACPE